MLQKLSYETGEKTITFEKSKIRVEIAHPGTFTEILPVLISEDDVISVNNGQIHLKTAEGSVLIVSSEKDGIKVKDFESDLGNRECKVIEISAKDRLIYEFVFYRRRPVRSPNG